MVVVLGSDSSRAQMFLGAFSFSQFLGRDLPYVEESTTNILHAPLSDKITERAVLYTRLHLASTREISDISFRVLLKTTLKLQYA
ncbi:hypothetical protein KIN20_032419 [Parelaphostrongylus tenuis]|uniref:Uncharacterized protein n=1 Tax=Parelaphostrongylus tenuis TaxID=148309 RepID=A0AAD5R6W3_PARTN|nr:hypothetical protein KIN20_032419 [Parelaphostrongylus tenuis]